MLARERERERERNEFDQTRTEYNRNKIIIKKNTLVVCYKRNGKSNPNYKQKLNADTT